MVAHHLKNNAKNDVKKLIIIILRSHHAIFRNHNPRIYFSYHFSSHIFILLLHNIYLFLRPILTHQTTKHYPNTEHLTNPTISNSKPSHPFPNSLNSTRSRVTKKKAARGCVLRAFTQPCVYLL